MKTVISIKPPIITSIILLLLAVFPFPYGYYVLLRLVVFFTAVFLAWYSYKIEKTTWIWIMGFIALIFNPFVPIHFSRGLWIIFDLVTAGIFGKYLFKFK